MKRSLAVASSTLFLVGVLAGQQWTNWTSTSSNAEIVYRSQPFANAKACYIEYRDDLQGRGNTTFDATVDYKSTDLDSAGLPTVKKDSEHVVIVPGRVGSARISNCSEVLDVHASFVQRH